MLDPGAFLSLKIPLPPLEAQQAIAAKLDALDSTAKGLKAAAAAAKETMRVTLAKALAPGALPPGPAEVEDIEAADETEDYKSDPDGVGAAPGAASASSGFP